MLKSFLTTCSDCNIDGNNDLSYIPESILEEISTKSIHNKYKKGNIIFYEGNIPYGVYFIIKGKIKLFNTSQEGKEYIIKIAKEGDILGYKAFLNHGEFSASAEALEESHIRFIDKNDFMNILNKYPNFAMILLEIMAREIKCYREVVNSLAYKTSNERIIDLLINLKKTFGVLEKNGYYRIDVQLSREEISNMIGSTLETGVRLLSWLKEKNVIETNNKYIYIKDLKSLIDISSYSKSI